MMLPIDMRIFPRKKGVYVVGGAYSHLENFFNSEFQALVGSDSRFLTEFLSQMDSARAVLIKWGVLFHKIGKPQSQKAVSNGTLTYCGYAAKSAAMVRQICRRLRFSRRQCDHISFIIRLHRRPYYLFQVRQKMRSIDRMFIRFFMKCGDAVPAILLLGLAEFIGNTGPSAAGPKRQRPDTGIRFETCGRFQAHSQTH